MKEQMLLIDSFPLILDDLPGFLERLEKYYGWRKKESSPSKFLRNWESQSLEGKFYFLGWFEEAMRQHGVGGNMCYMLLREKMAVSSHIQRIVEEANQKEIECFRRGAKELYRKR